MDDNSALLDWFRIDKQDSQVSTRHKATWQRQEKIGEGTFGVVFREVDQSTGLLRAVKEVRKRHFFDYRHELVALTRLARPAYEDFFGKFLGWGEDPTTVWMYMEYFRHGDLSNYITAKEPFREEDCKDIVFQLLSGLAIMHADGITHRDLKPQNIFVLQRTPSWRAKIGDFGVSKRVCEDETNLRTTVGSKFYMAPEVAGYVDAEGSNNTYNSRIDIWSVGVVTFKLLTGKVPFDPISQLINYCHGKLSFPKIEHGVSDRGKTFVQELLQPQSSFRLDASEALNHLWLEKKKTETIGSLQSEVCLEATSLAKRLSGVEVSQRTASEDATSSTYRTAPQIQSANIHDKEKSAVITLSQIQNLGIRDESLLNSHADHSHNMMRSDMMYVVHATSLPSDVSQTKEIPHATQVLTGEDERQKQNVDIDIVEQQLQASKLKNNGMTENVSPKKTRVELKPAPYTSTKMNLELAYGQSDLPTSRTSNCSFLEDNFLNWETFGEDISIDSTVDACSVYLFDCFNFRIIHGYVPRNVVCLVQRLKETGWPFPKTLYAGSYKKLNDLQTLKAMKLQDYSSADLAFALTKQLASFRWDQQFERRRNQDLYAGLKTPYRDLLLFLFDFLLHLKCTEHKNWKACMYDLLWVLGKGAFCNYSYRWDASFNTKENLKDLLAFYHSRLLFFNCTALTIAGISGAEEGLEQSFQNSQTKTNNYGGVNSKSTDEFILTNATNLISTYSEWGTFKHPQWAYSVRSPFKVASMRVSYVELTARHEYFLQVYIRNDGTRVWEERTLRLHLRGHDTIHWDAYWNENSVKPGDTSTFVLRLRAPDSPVYFAFYLSLSPSDFTLVGDRSIVWARVVSAEESEDLLPLAQRIRLSVEEPIHKDLFPVSTYPVWTS